MKGFVAAVWTLVFPWPEMGAATRFWAKERPWETSSKNPPEASHCSQNKIQTSASWLHNFSWPSSFLSSSFSVPLPFSSSLPELLTRQAVPDPLLPRHDPTLTRALGLACAFSSLHLLSPHPSNFGSSLPSSRNTSSVFLPMGLRRSWQGPRCLI